MRAVLAGYGFLGQKIAEELNRAGFAVTVIRRSAAAVTGTEFVACDLTMQSPPLKADKFDAAVFCLAPGRRDEDLYRKTYCDAQQNFLHGIEAEKYVYISSTAVYPDAADVYTEENAAPHSARAKILLEAEAIALRQPRACVLRLAGLYSEVRKIYSAETGAYTEDRMVHWIHRDDAARAVTHSLQKNLNGVFNVHDGNPLLRSVILQRLNGTAALPGPHATVQRIIDAGKFSGTGFKPVFADYFAGTGT